MNQRTQLLIGLTVIVLGVLVLALARFGEEDQVRQVREVVDDPARHDHGDFVMLGVPQPPEIPLTGDEGIVLRPNPDFRNATVQVTAWQRDGLTYHSANSLTVAYGAEGRTHWTFRNETRLQGNPDLAFPAVEAAWDLEGLAAFPVQGFDDGMQPLPRLWAIYTGAEDEPMQPKPSQFTGRLLSALPDGTPLPAGALVFEVDDYTAGCSSKFLPPEERESLAAEGKTP